MRVVVIGAGLGRLALAQGLRRAGIDVVVCERDASLTARRQGYRLHLDADARDALVEVLPPQLVDVFHRTAGVPAARFTVLDNQLNEILSLEAENPSVDFAVDRLVLRQLLLSGIEDAVVFGKQFESYDNRTCYFDDGSQVFGDGLVAADGVNSTVRRQYLPHARIVDTRGVAALRRDPAHRAHPHAVRRAHVRYLHRDREWFAADPRAMTGAELHAIVTAAVSGWHPRVRAIVAACDPATMFALPLRTSVPIDPWPATRVTLLGDAIHAMSPAAGAGACVALRDAARLTVALGQAAAGRDLVDAIGDYESAMLDYGFAAVREGAANGQRFLGQDPLPVS